MAAKTILVLCAQALFTQCVSSQCTSRAAVEASGPAGPYGCAGSLAGPGFGYNGIGSPCGYDGLVNPAGFASRGFAYDGLNAGFGGRGLACDGIYAPAIDFIPTSGGAFTVTSSSATAPVGISVSSDNVYEGVLSVAGELPFVGTSGLEGMLPTAGSGAINHGCGNGLNAMSALSETSSPASVASFTGPVFGAPAYGYDGLITPAIAAPGLAYNGLSYGDAACAGIGLAYDGLGYGSAIDAIEIIPTSGGALPVSSASAVSPTGIAVASDNAYEGALAVGGELPFVGTVGLEGVVPSAGAGAVNHACGNGRNAMISETSAFGPGAYGALGTGITPAGAFAPGFGASGLGYRGGFAGRGCGAF